MSRLHAAQSPLPLVVSTVKYCYILQIFYLPLLLNSLTFVIQLDGQIPNSTAYSARWADPQLNGSTQLTFFSRTRRLAAVFNWIRNVYNKITTAYKQINPNLHHAEVLRTQKISTSHQVPQAFLRW
jgi:hypothetical protein